MLNVLQVLNWADASLLSHFALHTWCTSSASLHPHIAHARYLGHPWHVLLPYSHFVGLHQSWQFLTFETYFYSIQIFSPLLPKDLSPPQCYFRRNLLLLPLFHFLKGAIRVTYLKQSIWWSYASISKPFVNFLLALW